MTEALKLPTEVVDSAWEDDIDPTIKYELVGGDEEGEIAYKNEATPIKKSEVKNATTDYKDRKIGHMAILRLKDKIAA